MIMCLFQSMDIRHEVIPMLVIIIFENLQIHIFNEIEKVYVNSCLPDYVNLILCPAIHRFYIYSVATAEPTSRNKSCESNTIAS
jgi:hypothetical protein